MISVPLLYKDFVWLFSEGPPPVLSPFVSSVLLGKSYHCLKVTVSEVSKTVAKEDPLAEAASSTSAYVPNDLC